MSTRILSVFSLLMRVGFALLLLGGGAFAQPQPEVIWARNGISPQAYFGSPISSLGDQNDDGFNDWAVSAPGDWEHFPEQSYVELFYGGNPPSNTPYRRFTTGDSLFNVCCLTSFGDLNGDTYIDYEILLWPVFEEGLVSYFYLGGIGQDTLPDLVYANDFDVPEGIGDFNHDGFDDFGVYDGAFRICFGGITLDTVVDWYKLQCSPMVTFGDINGDGADDLVEQGFAADSIWIYFGSIAPDTLPDIGIHQSVMPTPVNDLNGDGRDDFLVPQTQTIDVYFGSEILSSQPDYILQWPGFCYPGDLFSAGDFNHDGANDLVAIGYTCLNTSGRLGMYLGYHWINPNPIFEIWGWEEDLVGIRTACALGDVNGDGIDDVAIGANRDIAARGRAIIIAGSEEYVVPANESSPEFPEHLSISVYPNPFNAETTIEFKLPLFATEVELRVFNTLGQQVKQFSLHTMSPTLQHRFHAFDLPTGIYFLQASSGKYVATTKLMIIR